MTEICPDCDHSLDLVEGDFDDYYICGNRLCGKTYIPIPVTRPVTIAEAARVLLTARDLVVERAELGQDYYDDESVSLLSLRTQALRDLS
ncbi:hypothetical protein [Sulfitobacter faviae]|uniref:hypothetical protein n=1 Tax=Sulfitobacter faviae TaxID=1775881 RepID=UPI00398CBFB6